MVGLTLGLGGATGGTEERCDEGLANTRSLSIGDCGGVRRRVLACRVGARDAGADRHPAPVDAAIRRLGDDTPPQKPLLHGCRHGGLSDISLFPAVFAERAVAHLEPVHLVWQPDLRAEHILI